MFCVGLSPGRVKPKTRKLVFAASLLSMQHDEERALGSESDKCVDVKSDICCFSELAL
jgi:hypothetical protein